MKIDIQFNNTFKKISKTTVKNVKKKVKKNFLSKKKKKSVKKKPKQAIYSNALTCCTHTHLCAKATFP